MTPLRQQGLGDQRGRLVIVVPVASEDLAREGLERRERLGQVLDRLVGLHRQEVAGEQHQIRRLGHGALADGAEARHGHERAEVRIGDLDEAERAAFAGRARG